MKLSVIIPTWNGWTFLAANLPFVWKAVRPLGQDVEVLIVDDGGDDETSSRLLEEFPWTRLLRREVNGGFSAACNTGIEEAKGDWVLLLNNDMRPLPDAVTRLLRRADSAPNTVFSLRPRIVRGVPLSDDDYRHMAMRLALRSGMLRMPLVLLPERTDGLSAFPITSGGAGLFRLAILKDMGGFDEIYNPFYWEDVDLGYRALSRGYSTLYEPEAVFQHAVRGSIATTYSSALVSRVSQRNAYWFHWINIHDRYLFLRHVMSLPLHLMVGLLRGEWWRIAAFRDAMMGVWPAWRKRKLCKMARRVSDRQILATYSFEHAVSCLSVGRNGKERRKS